MIAYNKDHVYRDRVAENMVIKIWHVQAILLQYVKPEKKTLSVEVHQPSPPILQPHVANFN
ncbi:MAG: hypothetical protein DSY43_05940 [Gammaproteobacteria bacterium]|nr:MAG: hypothetical protein DSY43_05940 [Gammaproteobacteria bacterium]